MSNRGPATVPALDMFTVPVPSGAIESPLETRHVIDMHLGDPVQASCRVDGRERRGLLTHGLFAVMPAGAQSQWMMTRPAHALIVRLTPELLDQTADAMGLPPRTAELVPTSHVRDPQIERLGWILQAEHDDAYASGPLFVDCLAQALAVRLLGLQGRGAPPAARALPGWRLRNVLDYIEAHLDKSLSLAELATVAGFSTSHFKALFKQTVGVPVHRYVLERRVERARTLLVDGTRTMTEIALEAGFSHQSHMARCMRRVLGVSPSQLVAR